MQQTFSAIGASGAALMPDALTWNQGTLDSDVTTSNSLFCSLFLWGRMRRSRNQYQNQNQNQTRAPGLTARQRCRVGRGSWLHLRWSVIPKLVPTWAKIPTEHVSPDHRIKASARPSGQLRSQNNDGPLPHSTQTSTANCTHGGCRNCLRSATIKENCATNHVLPRLRLPPACWQC